LKRTVSDLETRLNWRMNEGDHRRGRSQEFVTGDKTGSGGRKSPGGVQGQSPGGGLGAKPPEAEDKFSRYDGGTCTHVIIILFTVAL